MNKLLTTMAAMLLTMTTQAQQKDYAKYYEASR